MLFCPYEPFWGSKAKNLKYNFSLGYFTTPMTLFRHTWMTNGCQIQNQRTKLSLGTQKNPKNDLWRHQRSLTSDDLGWPRNGHNVSVNHGCHLATPIHVHITSKNTEVRKFQSLKRYGTYISLDMPLEIRSHVKRSWQVRSWHFQKRCKIVQWIGSRYLYLPTKFCDDRTIRSRVILGKPEGGCINLPLCQRGLTCLAVQITKKWPSRGHVCR